MVLPAAWCQPVASTDQDLLLLVEETTCAEATESLASEHHEGNMRDLGLGNLRDFKSKATLGS